MKPERPRRVEVLFGQALEHPVDKRAAFLEEVCGGHGEVRREVEGLLQAHEEAGSFLLDSAWGETFGPSDSELGGFAGPSFVGPYRLLRKIGEGGMSVVYLAVRADEQFRRRVAIKLLRQSRATEALLRRFASERQILAAMDHPNIAKLHDAGTTPEGLPYFVMDNIEGEPLDEYCDRHRLTIRERLQLFRQVCSAVHYAHQNLVVHRDLKPGNILVTEEGVPKLLDFGIAKLLKPEMLPEGLDPTLTWHRALTPDYASPEQVQGKPITTASDVYSLGVILYQLLTGHLPHRLGGRSPREIERVLTEKEAEKPSIAIERLEQASSPDDGSALDPAQICKARCSRLEPLRRQLAGDLDNIVAMALRKEPQRRYVSAEQLSEDVRRHLAGLPVFARQDTLGYRLGKFLRRNRVAVTVAAAIFALALGSAIVLALLAARLADQRDKVALLAARITEQRDQAQRERDKLGEVLAFLGEIFEVSDPDKARGKTITAREILDRAGERIARELAGQPEVQATLMNTIGDVYRRLGLYAEAEALLKMALEIRTRDLGEEHLDVAESLDSLGRLKFRRGEYEAAEPLLLKALELRRRLLGTNHPDVAASLMNVADLSRNRGAEEKAEALFRQALKMRRELFGDHHPDVAASLSSLAVVLQEKGDYAAAEPLQRQVLANYRQRFGEDHMSVASSLNNLGLTLEKTGAYDEAEHFLSEALEIWRRLLGDDHQQIVLGLNNLASLASYRGDYEKALSLYEEALERAQNIGIGGHPNVAYLLLGLGRSMTRVGNPEGGETFLRQAVERRRQSLPAGHWLIAWAESTRGECLTRLGRYEEAAPLLVESYRVIAAQRPASDWETIQALERVVDLYQAWSKPEKAAEYRAILSGSVTPDSSELHR